MQVLLETYWPLLLAALLIGLAVAWLLFKSTRKTRVQMDRRDVLDEGAAGAERNKALIDAAPAASADPAPASARPETGGDDLTRIKGLGPKIAAMLGDQGVTTFAQIAAWSDADIDRIDASLGRFEGRIRRDRWVDQAKLLESGDIAGFDAEFGNS